MKNKRYVEGSICDAYLVEETTHFASFYFEDNVQSRRTQIGRNLNDGGIDTSLPTTLSVFNRPGRPIDAKGQRYLNNKERFAAHQYILLNYEEVQPILRLYETGLRQYNPGVTDQDIDNEVEKNFASWFRDYVYNPGNNICNQSLIDLACGPLLQATTYNGLVVNGFKFQTEEQCVRKSTNNFGVSIKGTSLSHDESFFFDTLKEKKLSTDTTIWRISSCDRAQNPIWRNLPLQTELKTPFGEISPCKQSSRPQRNLLLQTELKTADTNRHVLPPFATVVGTTVASCQSEPHILLCRLPKEKNN
nr:uncharacterized protein LOC109185082 [Ipomoea batatas]